MKASSDDHGAVLAPAVGVMHTVDVYRGGHRTTYQRIVHEPDPADAAAAAPFVDQMIDAAIEAGIHPHDAASFLSCLLIELEADREAYEREAARRGVLAL